MTNEASLIRILRCFLKEDILGFTELAERLNFDTDLTGYYLRKLQAKNLLVKAERGKYQITPIGKSVLAHSRQLVGSATIPRVSVMLVAKQQDSYLVVERNKQPFLGKLEWPTWPLELGDSLQKVANHVTEQRLGFKAEPLLHGIFRRIDMYDDEVFDDKLFAVHVLNLSEGVSLLVNNEAGALKFVTKEEIETHTHASRALADILSFSEGNITFTEKWYTLTSEDLYK